MERPILLGIVKGLFYGNDGRDFKNVDSVKFSGVITDPAALYSQGLL